MCGECTVVISSSHFFEYNIIAYNRCSVCVCVAADDGGSSGVDVDGGDGSVETVLQLGTHQ